MRFDHEPQNIKRQPGLGTKLVMRADSCVIHAGMQATDPSGCGITTSSAPR
jgi:hypothetical protein